MTETGTPRPTRRRAETRSRLLRAALEVFSEKGFGRTTVDDVCARAGYTRGAFYSNFVSLDELFLTVWQERSDEFLVAAEVAVEAASQDPVASLEEGIDRLLELSVIDESWARIEWEFTAHALRTPGLREVMAAREARISELLLSILDRALAQVDRRITDRAAFAAALIAVHDGTTVQVLVEPDTEAARHRRRALFLAVVNNYTEPVSR